MVGKTVTKEEAGRDTDQVRLERGPLLFRAEKEG